MSYYSKNNKTDLDDIGKESFEVVDEFFPCGWYSYPPLQVVNRHQRQRQQDKYVIQRVYVAPVAVVQGQRYNPPVAAMTTEKAIDSNEAAMKYHGINYKYVEYSKRKPARN